MQKKLIFCAFIAVLSSGCLFTQEEASTPSTGPSVPDVTVDVMPDEEDETQDAMEDQSADTPVDSKDSSSDATDESLDEQDEMEDIPFECPVHDEPGATCYSKFTSTSGNDCWEAVVPEVSFETCKSYDRCSPDGGAMGDPFRCFKWTERSDSNQNKWRCDYIESPNAPENSCFWLSTINETRNCWIILDPTTTEQQCAGLGAECGSGGACYKWTPHNYAPRNP